MAMVSWFLEAPLRTSKACSVLATMSSPTLVWYVTHSSAVHRNTTRMPLRLRYSYRLESIDPSRSPYSYSPPTLYLDQDGIYDKKLVCFTSAHSHYTIKRGANMMGIGMQAARYVPVLPDGKMDPAGTATSLCIQ